MVTYQYSVRSVAWSRLDLLLNRTVTAIHSLEHLGVSFTAFVYLSSRAQPCFWEGYHASGQHAHTSLFSSTNLPNGKVPACLLLLLPSGLPNFVQLQHLLARTSEACHNFTHAARLQDRIRQAIFAICDHSGQLHATHEVLAADQMGCSTDCCVVSNHNLWEVSSSDLGQLLGFGIWNC